LVILGATAVIREKYLVHLHNLHFPCNVSQNMEE